MGRVDGPMGRVDGPMRGRLFSLRRHGELGFLDRARERRRFTRLIGSRAVQAGALFAGAGERCRRIRRLSAAADQGRSQRDDERSQAITFDEVPLAFLRVDLRADCLSLARKY